MAIATEILFSLNDRSIQQFLAGDTTEFASNIAGPDGFEEIGRRESPFPVQKRTVESLLRETWIVEQRGAPLGKISDIVVMSCELSITLIHVLFLKKGLPPATAVRAKSLIDLYKPEDGRFDRWVAEQISDGWISDADFAVDAVVYIRKEKTSEKDTSQRDVLFRLYGRQPRPSGGSILVKDPEPFEAWAGQRQTTIRLISKDAVFDSGGPQQSLQNIEVKPSGNPGEAADSDLPGILNAIAKQIIPSNCGQTTNMQKKIFSLKAWPEFKINWEMETIKVGCVILKTLLPVPYMRWSTLVLYARYQRPNAVDETFLLILETCVERSALTGAVIGVVVGDFGAAASAFESACVRCMEGEIIECINPGLLLITEAGDWHKM